MLPSVPLCSLYIFLLIAEQVAADWSSASLATNVTTNVRARRQAPISNGRFMPGARIFGGKPAKRNQFPYAASIWDASFEGHSCGGSVLSEDIILTAAHCLYNNDKKIEFASDISVHLGSANNSNPDPKYIFPVKHIFMPEKYNYDAHSGDGYDIALLRLERKIKWSQVNQNRIKRIWPISLPADESDLPVASSCRVVGWGAAGYDSEGRGIYPEWLRHVRVPILDEQICQQAYKNGFNGDYNSDSFLCAGYTDDRGKDSCAGDSGGPLVCRQQSYPKQFRQYGIVSFGEPPTCGETPGFYTKVTRFLRMINKYSK